jgi:kynurenine formamidase
VQDPGQYSSQIHRAPIACPSALSLGPKIFKNALECQNTEIREGDAVLIHTGHGSLWIFDNDRCNSGEPSIGMEAALWLAEQNTLMTAAATRGIEVVPDEGPKAAFPVNQELINKRGIYNLENLNVGVGQGPVL